jgi:catalase
LAHIASALVFELSKVEHPHIRLAMVGHLRHIEEDLAKRVAAGLALNQLPDAPIAAVPVKPMKPSPALQLIGKMKATLEGRAIGILIADGSDGRIIKKIKQAATDAGASVKIIAPKVGGAKLADGSLLAADGQLAGTPSVLFDAVAVILSDEGTKSLAKESAAIDFVRDAFGHLKAIAVDKGGRALLERANVGQDAGIVAASAVKTWFGRAVITTTGSNGHFRVRRPKRSHPFPSDSFRSSTTKSGGAVLAACKAAAPVAADRTEYPSPASTRLSTVRTDGSSSTTNICF